MAVLSALFFHADDADDAESWLYGAHGDLFSLKTSVERKGLLFRPELPLLGLVFKAAGVPLASKMEEGNRQLARAAHAEARRFVSHHLGGANPSRYAGKGWLFHVERRRYVPRTAAISAPAYTRGGLTKPPASLAS